MVSFLLPPFLPRVKDPTPKKNLKKKKEKKRKKKKKSKKVFH